MDSLPAILAKLAETLIALNLALVGMTPAEKPEIKEPTPREIIISENGILGKIASCESENRHFDETGEIVKNFNTNGTTDWGRWQINDIHENEAKRIGIDYKTEEGNERFALYLYEKRGTQPWRASYNCLQRRFGIDMALVSKK